MDMPKQMGTESANDSRQQQGETARPRSEANNRPEERRQQLAQTPAEQMGTVHFSDWASI